MLADNVLLSFSDGSRLTPLLEWRYMGMWRHPPLGGSHVVCPVGCAHACVKACAHVQVCKDTQV